MANVQIPLLDARLLSDPPNIGIEGSVLVACTKSNRTGFMSTNNTLTAWLFTHSEKNASSFIGTSKIGW